MTKTIKWPLDTIVEVTWRDSHSAGGWKTIREHNEEAGTGPMRTSGYIIRMDKDVVQIGQNMSAWTQHVADVMTIPREVVLHVRRVGKTKRP